MALWVYVLRGKYITSGEVNFLNSKKTFLYLTWHAILNQAATLSSNTGQSIGNGRKDKIWIDN